MFFGHQSPYYIPQMQVMEGDKLMRNNRHYDGHSRQHIRNIKNNNGSGRFNFFTFILLIILIILFHTEIMMLGVWLYTSVYPNPDGNRLLGTYYQIAAKRNKENADKFYALALSQQIKDLPNISSTKEKAEMNLNIGRYYECAQGTTIDIEKAKSFYQEAKTEAATLNDEDLNKKIQNTLSNADQGYNDPAANPNCTSDSDYMFINSSLNTMNFMPNAKPGTGISAGSSTGDSASSGTGNNSNTSPNSSSNSGSSSDSNSNPSQKTKQRPTED